MSIRQELLEFISREESNGALLLTGPWGCGKTHILREITSELNCQDKYALAFISLFGVNSGDAFNHRVKESVAYAKTFNRASQNQKNAVTALLGVVKTISSTLSDSSATAKSIDAALSINWYDFIDVTNEVECYRQDGPSVKKLVLIFDDLERCGLNAVDLLGLINDYSENRKIKTIIVADENHIKEETRAQYDDFKEKLIYRTIRLVSEYNEIINQIIASYKETVPGYRTFLEINAKLLKCVFFESKLENLRTFKSLIIDFERVYNLWKHLSAPLDRLSGILYTFGAILFESRANQYKQNEKYGYVFDRTKLKEKYKDIGDYSAYLASLEKWITTGEWYEGEVADEIKRKYLPAGLDLDEGQKFLYINFWDLEQKNIDEGFPIAVERAYESELTCDELITLLQKSHSLKKYDISLPCDIDYVRIQEGFKHRKEKIKSMDIVEPERRLFSQSTEIDAEAGELYNEIEKLDDLIRAWKNRSIYISYLNKDASITRYDFRGEYIDKFDEDLLRLFVMQYKASDNSNKRELALSLFDLHMDDPQYSNSDCIIQSIANLNGLKEQLEACISFEKDQISKAITRSFIQNIDIHLQRLTPIVVK